MNIKKKHGCYEVFNESGKKIAEFNTMEKASIFCKKRKNSLKNLEGTDALVQNYKCNTPGQEPSKKIKEEQDENSKDYSRWRSLVNMGPQEIETFLNSGGGKVAGLNRKEAKTAGTRGNKITSGRDSARAIIRMLRKPRSEWDESDYKWMRKQISFISRMKGVSGSLRDKDGNPTRKLLALKVWGHNPEK